MNKLINFDFTFLGTRLRSHSFNHKQIDQSSDGKINPLADSEHKSSMLDWSSTSLIPGDINPLELEQVLREIKEGESSNTGIFPFNTVGLLFFIWLINLSFFKIKFQVF